MKNHQLIVGLGNPGKKYEYTRHNFGFLVLERLAEDLNLKFKSGSFTKGLAAKISGDEGDIYFLMPSTYMNLSGIAVASALKAKNIALGRVLIICDDLSLPFGKLRLKPNGSAGGHNGLKSIIEYLQSNQFARLRMGINHPGGKAPVVDYVLEDFNKEEKKQLTSFVDLGYACASAWMKEGIVKAMEQFN